MSGSDSGATRNIGIGQGRTPAAGFALQNGTPNILTFTTPNDGNIHGYYLASSMNVTVLEVGGAVNLNFTAGGHAYSNSVFNSGAAVGNYIGVSTFPADPNTTVTLVQTAALTSGAAVVFASIVGT